MDHHHTLTCEFQRWVDASLEGQVVIIKGDHSTQLGFASENDLIAYNLAWTEELVAFPHLILPLLQEAMLSIIADHIIGVTGVNTSIKIRAPSPTGCSGS